MTLLNKHVNNINISLSTTDSNLLTIIILIQNIPLQMSNSIKKNSLESSRSNTYSVNSTVTSIKSSLKAKFQKHSKPESESTSPNSKKKEKSIKTNYRTTSEYLALK